MWHATVTNWQIVDTADWWIVCKKRFVQSNWTKQNQPGIVQTQQFLAIKDIYASYWQLIKIMSMNKNKIITGRITAVTTTRA